MVVGQVGSGKSSLLAAILGEMTSLSGDVAIDEYVAFYNVTLRVPSLSSNLSVVRDTFFCFCFLNGNMTCCILPRP